jgi:hypothetical protein
MAVSAHDVAAEIRRRQPSVGTKKLHKLLYYCQGHYLAAFGGRDLEVMTHGEPPWKLADAARRQRDRAVIRPEWMLEYFRTDGAPDDGVDDVPLDSDAVSRWLRDLAAADDGAPGVPDTADSLRAWATGGS